MLGLSAVGQLAHACEDLLKASREGRVAVKATTDLLLRACDALSDLLDDLAAAKDGSGASEAMVARLSSTSGQPVPPLHPRASRPDPSVSVSRPPGPAAPPPAAAPSSPGPSPSAPRAAEELAERQAARPLDSRQRRDPRHAGAAGGRPSGGAARDRLRSEELSELLERFARLGDNFLKLYRGRALDDETAHRSSSGWSATCTCLRDDSFRFVRAARRRGQHAARQPLADGRQRGRGAPGAALDALRGLPPRGARASATRRASRSTCSIENTNVGVDRSMVADVRDALVHLLAQRGGPRHRDARAARRRWASRWRAGCTHSRARRRRHARHRGRGRRPRHRPEAAEGQRRCAKRVHHPGAGGGADRSRGDRADLPPRLLHPRARSASCPAAAWAWTW